MADAWGAAFKEIYGNTPTKNDYKNAPEHVKKAYFANHKPSPVKKLTSGVRREAIPCLKRPADSPIKHIVKKHKLTEDTKLEAKTSSCSTKAYRNIFSTKPSTSPPLKKIQTILTNSPSRRHNGSHNDITTTSKMDRKSVSFFSMPPEPGSSTLQENQFSSPVKSPSRLLSMSRTLFDTPEKGQPSIWDSMNKNKSMTSSQRTPTKSPRKPIKNDMIMTRNIGSLLMPTPEKKKEEEIELEPFIAEEVSAEVNAQSKKPKLKKGTYAASFNPKTGKIIKRAFKRVEKKEGDSSDAAVPTKKTSTRKPKAPKNDNFVRINMKKKSYVRGKISAEQKRKMRKKANWKKRFGNGSK